MFWITDKRSKKPKTFEPRDIKQLSWNSKVVLPYLETVSFTATELEMTDKIVVWYKQYFPLIKLFLAECKLGATIKRLKRKTDYDR